MEAIQINLLDLFIKIEAKDEATGKIEMVTESVKNSAKKIGKFILGISTAVAGAGVALGKVGLTYNAQMENYTTNFEVMLGSAEKAAAKVEELKTMAAKTPFGMKDLADATQTLLAFQVSAEESTDILRMLGDIALGDKNKLSGLALVFGQVSSAGKLQGQDLMQLINQGFNPLNYIAKRTGETMEELRDRMSKGGISAEEVTQAFKDATSEGGQFYKGMEAASKTLTGQLSTLKDNVTALIGKAFEPLSKKLTDEIIPKVIEFVDSFDLEAAQERLHRIIKVFKNLLPAIVGVITPALTFFGILKAFAIVKSVAAGFQLLNMVLKANPIIAVISVVAGLIAAIITLWKTNEGFRNAVAGIWDSVKNVFISAWEKIKSVWAEVSPYFKAIWESIKSTFSTVVSFFTRIFKNAWEGIKAAWAGVTDFFSQIWATVAGIFSVARNVLTGNFSEAWEGIKSVFAGWSSYFGGLWDDLKSIFGNAWETFKDIGSNIVGGIKQGISDAWSGLKNWFNELWNSLFGNRNVNVNVNTPNNGNYRAGGLDYVPSNGFSTILHKGEAVLTRAEADDWREGNKSGSPRHIVINQYIQAVASTPVQFASATAASFEQAVWSL